MSDSTHAQKPCQCCDDLPDVRTENMRLAAELADIKAHPVDHPACAVANRLIVKLDGERDTLRAELAAQKERAETAEADAVTLRELVMLRLQDYHYGYRHGGSFVDCPRPTCGEMRSAIQTESGRTFLDELKTTRAELAAAKEELGAFRSSIGELIDQQGELMAELTAAREAFMTYRTHLPGCPQRKPPGHPKPFGGLPCTCGLDAALAAGRVPERTTKDSLVVPEPLPTADFRCPHCDRFVVRTSNRNLLCAYCDKRWPGSAGVAAGRAPSEGE